MRVVGQPIVVMVVLVALQMGKYHPQMNLGHSLRSLLRHIGLVGGLEITVGNQRYELKCTST